MSKKWIAILEDDHRRRVEMFRLLDDRLFMYPVAWFRTATEMVAWLKETDWQSILLASLDHDLEDVASDSRESPHDAGTGRDVVDFLINFKGTLPNIPVIVHTTNVTARIGMVEALRHCKWPVHQVAPYDDLEWIQATWYPTVKAAMRNKQSKPQSITTSVNVPVGNGGLQEETFERRETATPHQVSSTSPPRRKLQGSPRKVAQVVPIPIIPSATPKSFADGGVFETFLLRHQWLRKDEFIALTYAALKSTPDGLEGMRPVAFEEVLSSSGEVLKSVLERSGALRIEELVERWQQWHVDNCQPISQFSFLSGGPQAFGRRLYEFAEEKRLCGSWITEHIVHDADHVVMNEGTSTFWVGLAILAKRQKVNIATSNEALVRELSENPKLRMRAGSIHVIGGEMDVIVGGGGQGFVGQDTREGFDSAIRDKPGATVVICSVSGLLPEKGPFAVAPVSGFTRHSLLAKALESNVRRVVLIADYSKMRPSLQNQYGYPVFADKRQWESILEHHIDRIAIVVSPPDEVRSNAELMSIAPNARAIRGHGYSRLVVEYLMTAARFDEICSNGRSGSQFYETTSTPQNVLFDI